MRIKDKISIIVPVYQAQEYIANMIDSVIQQTYQNWELLLVDDGSQDDSGKICDSYHTIEERVRVFHIPNGGVAHARSVGLSHAQGEYIFFLDSDDWLSCQTLEKLYECLLQEEADIVSCLFIKEYERLRLPYYPQLKKRCYDSTAIVKELMKNKRIKNYVWGKLCKRELLDSIDLTSMRLFEDVSIIHHLFMNANKIILHPYYGYHYRIRSNSLTSKMDLDKLFQMKHAFYHQQQEIMQLNDAITEMAQDPFCMSDIMILCYLNSHMEESKDTFSKINHYTFGKVSPFLYFSWWFLYHWVGMKQKRKKR